MTDKVWQTSNKITGLENDGPLFASHTSRTKDIYLHDETVIDVVWCCLEISTYCSFQFLLFFLLACISTHADPTSTRRAIFHVPQNGRFPAQDADEPPCKFGAVSLILAGEIRNRTNTHTHNSNRYIHSPHFAYQHVWIIKVE